MINIRLDRFSPAAVTASFALVLMTMLPSAAHANIPLPTLFGFMMPAWLGFLTLGLSLLVVVVVEAAVLRMALQCTFRRAVTVSFLMNAISTLIGFCLAAHPLEMIALLFIPTFAAQWASLYLRWKGTSSIILGIGIFAILLIVMLPWGNVPTMVIQVYVTFGVSFLLTLLIEACWIARDEKVERPWRAAIFANGASYALILAFLFLSSFRSGALATIDWPIYQLTKQGCKDDADRARVTAQVRELYEWQSSGDNWRRYLGAPSYSHYPWSELQLVEDWAKEGNLQDARELFAVIDTYCPRPDDDEFLSNQWHEAEKAINPASTISNKQQSPSKEQPT